MIRGDVFARERLKTAIVGTEFESPSGKKVV